MPSSRYCPLGSIGEGIEHKIGLRVPIGLPVITPRATDVHMNVSGFRSRLQQEAVTALPHVQDQAGGLNTTQVEPFIINIRHTGPGYR
jgi:hypothetical protein